MPKQLADTVVTLFAAKVNTSNIFR